MHVTTEIATDLLTPLGAYLRLREGARAAFLLESVERGRLGRHSFVGRGSRFAGFDEAETLGEPVVGYLGYDVVTRFEPTVPLPDTGPGFPESRFVVPELLVRFDHARGVAEVLVGDPDEAASVLGAAQPEAECGTRTRGELQRFPERAEHVMLVDLGRNDLSRVSTPGSVHVEQFMTAERYSHVTHLVSEVVGELRDGVTPFELLRACFPAGTVSGAPKVRAMPIIFELERYRRGVYAGAVGYHLPESAELDTCIAIRTLWLRDGVAHLQAGGGIVADSDPAAEHEECLAKLRGLEGASDLAEPEQDAPRFS